MKYSIEGWSISKLFKLLNDKKLNLNPPYQRNDIWSLPAKKRLIDSIRLGYPLPSFFIYKITDESFEMVDGQQRTRAIRGYLSKIFPDLNRKKYSEEDEDYFLNQYLLPVVLIEEVTPDASMEDFYYRVNKFGTKLNRPEIIKAQYFDSPFQNLVEKVAYSDEFQKLNLFSEAALSRMQDLDFVAELLTLVEKGIFEKKKAVDDLYDSDLSVKKLEELEKQFIEILDHFDRFNKIYPLKETRYRQRNDFFTFFGFIKNNKSLKPNLLNEFYKILVTIGYNISPTNEDCYSFQEYATNCVSQSNSKRARLERDKFFILLLLNNDHQPLDKKNTPEENYVMIDILDYYKISQEELQNIQGYYLPPLDRLIQNKKISFNDEI